MQRPRPHPPGLSRLSREVIFDDEESNELETIPINEPASRPGSTAASRDYGFRASKPTQLPRIADEDTHTPLLPINTGSARAAQYPPDWSSTVPSARTLPLRLSSASATAHCSLNTATSPTRTFKRQPLTAAGTDTRFPPVLKEHPFAKGFESPRWRALLLHVAACALSAPLLLLVVRAAQGRTLFWARALVGAGCAVLGGGLGWSLVRMAGRILEAAVWATVIHQSRVPDSRAGVRLRDLAAHADDRGSSIAALRLLWDRHSYVGAKYEYRKFYDTRRWSFWIFFFIFNVVLSGALPFIMARLIDIGATTVHQHQSYTEVAVSADLSEKDIQAAQGLLDALQDLSLQWTLAPVQTDMPPAVYFTWGADRVYFAEVTPAQLAAGGTGLGSFSVDTAVPAPGVDDQAVVQKPVSEFEPGAILRFPRWGLRTKCAVIPDLADNLLPVSANNATYLFTPRATLANLFAAFNTALPAMFTSTLNLTSLMKANETAQLPSGFNITGVAMNATFSDDGAAYSTRSLPLDLGAQGTGFATLETALIRLNTSFAPHGMLPVLSSTATPDAKGFQTFVGYDAAVCLQLYEPWITEVANGTAVRPASLRIVAQGAAVGDVGAGEKRTGTPLDAQQVMTGALNSTGLAPAWLAAHQNSINLYARTNVGRYLPSPTIVSFTSSSGPQAYTALAAASYAHARSIADATTLLPYLVGSAPRLARHFSDTLHTTAAINVVGMAALLSCVCVVGAMSALWVPRLPLGAPRRGTGVLSWAAAFGLGGVGEVGMVDTAVASGGKGLVLGLGMELEEVEEAFGEIAVRWAA